MFLPCPALPCPMCPQDTTVGRGRTTAVEAIHAVTAPTLPRKPTRHSISPNPSKGGPASSGGCCDAACVAFGPRVGDWCCSCVHACVLRLGVRGLRGCHARRLFPPPFSRQEGRTVSGTGPELAVHTALSTVFVELGLHPTPLPPRVSHSLPLAAPRPPFSTAV
jgi:hypothetical protein